MSDAFAPPPPPRLDRRRLLARLALGALAIALPGCETNRETGRSQLLLVGDGELSRMALTAWADAKAKTPISRDVAAQARLARIGQRIQAAAGRGGETWEFVVFDTDEKNAFVLPGGKVGFYRGLMQLTENDDQVAAVLGHETGHVTARHAAERASQAMATQLAGAVVTQTGLRGIGTQVFGLGAQYGVLLPYERRQESEADILGVEYMHRAGFDVRQAIRLWELMETSRESRPPALLSTHPDPTNRIAAIRNYINARGYARV